MKGLASLMIVVGALMAGLSGLCTATFVLNQPAILPLSLALGGPFILLGLSTFAAGSQVFSGRLAPAYKAAVGVAYMVLGALGVLLFGFMLLERPSAPAAAFALVSLGVTLFGGSIYRLP